jgi:SARP family transcriptional regulator, regulator of embCAB operon
MVPRQEVIDSHADNGRLVRCPTWFAGNLIWSRGSQQLWGDLMIAHTGIPFQLNLFRRWQLLQNDFELPVSSRQQRVISALAIQGPRDRRYLSGLLWPNSPDALAMESLRASVHLIKHQAPELLVVRGPLLSLASGVGVDFQKHLENLRNCERLGSDCVHNDCLSHLRHDDLLPGWYDDWVIFEQHRLRGVLLRALLAHARHWLERGLAEKAVEAAERALEIEPLNETFVGLVIHGELNMGNRAKAVVSFENFRARLAEELCVQPSEQLTRLVAVLRT